MSVRCRRHVRHVRALLVLAAAMGWLAGCATDGVRRNDDGTLSIDCSGGYYDWSRCHQRAATECGKQGFEIVSRVSDEASAGVGYRDWSTTGSQVQRTLVVRCR